MTDTTFTKAVDTARAVLAGGASHYSADQLEDVLLKRARERACDGESVEQAFVKMLDSGDADVDAIYRAIDVLRVAEHAERVEPTRDVEDIAGQEDFLDSYVLAKRRSDESVPQAYSRLAKDDQTFAALYERMSRSRDAI